MTLLFASIALAISPTDKTMNETDKLQTWRGLASLSSLEEFSNLPSQRFVLIRSDRELRSFWKGIKSPSDQQPPDIPTIDFENQSILVVKNETFLNSMSLIGAPVIEDKSVKLRIRETRSARPIVDRFYFVCLTIPVDAKAISDGAQTKRIDELRD